MLCDTEYVRSTRTSCYGARIGEELRLYYYHEPFGLVPKVTEVRRAGEAQALVEELQLQRCADK